MGEIEQVDELTDGEVMMRVRGGDVEQLSILFERHHARLFNYCLRLTGDRETSRDLVQEVFFRMLKYRATYREEGTFLPWLYRLARNVCMDHLRGPRREVPHEEDAPEPVAAGPQPAETVERREETRLLGRALRELPVEKRELLVMARFASLGYDEIAQVLGCTVGAVRVRVHRALRELGIHYRRLAGEATP